MARLVCSSSGISGGQRRSSSVSPAEDRIDRTPDTWKSSPEWLAAASASSSPSSLSPQRSIAAAWNGLLEERGNIGTSAVPADKRADPSAASAVMAPRWRDSTKPDRTTSARTGLTGQTSAVIGHPQHGARVGRAHGRALCEVGGRRSPLDELGIARNRPAAGEGDRVFHAHPQVPARCQRSEQHRNAGPSDPRGRPGRAGRQRGDRLDQGRVRRRAYRLARPSPGRSAHGRRPAGLARTGGGAAPRCGRSRTARTPAPLRAPASWRRDPS